MRDGSLEGLDLEGLNLQLHLRPRVHLRFEKLILDGLCNRPKIAIVARHCTAGTSKLGSHRQLETGPSQDIVYKPRVGIKTHYVRRISHEVREDINVIEVDLPIARVD